ncbi:arsenate reductase family protein [Chryseomicrobium aureum]|uniref:arsenate reductase family protein n=1 Tax=Chryseomicrobium aureum TaxID=1441723 RepID=UPI00370DA66A
MAIEMYGYPICTTCKKAEKFLKDHDVEFTYHHIVENPPSRELLKSMAEENGIELKRLFNATGQKYREMGLKNRLPRMTDDEKLDLLVSDGMLIKRPFTTDGTKATIGFREEEFKNVWTK